MLITFQTDAHESITLFGNIAEQLLRMMGQTPRVPGALLASDVPHALGLLRKAVEGEKKHASIASTNPDEEPEVSLAHRALPLIALLQAAEDKHCDVMWR